MGKYTTNTNTDDQQLKPAVRRKLEERIACLPPPLQDFTVVRRIVLAPLVAKGPLRFEDVKLRVRAPNQADALRMADEAKYARDYKGG